jgi:Rod binding domain-containing protein
MDISTSQPFQTSLPADNASATSTASSSAGLSDAAAEKAAKGFESVLLGKLCDAMQASVQKSGLFEDDGMEQTQSIFWMNLAQDVGSKGGLGLWKQFYTQLKKDGLAGQAAPTKASYTPSPAQSAMDIVTDSAKEAGAW